MVSAPAVAFVARIASRNEMRPSGPGSPTRADTEVVVPSTVSAVVVTTRLPATIEGTLSSEVLLAGGRSRSR